MKDGETMTRIKKTNIYGPKKICQTCDKLLSQSHFHTHRFTEDRKQPHCKDCMCEKIRIGKENAAMKMSQNVIVETPDKTVLVSGISNNNLINERNWLVGIVNGPDAHEIHPGTKRKVWFRKNGKMSITYDHKGN
jgi:ribulose bisphosphate carboxylase small subunit